MFALVVAQRRDIRLAMERMEELGMADPQQRARSKQEIVIVSAADRDRVGLRGTRLEDGAFVNGWDRNLDPKRRGSIMAELTLCGLPHNCGTLYL